MEGDDQVRAGPLRILIVGATGRTGRLLVARALSRGHEVTALVRDPTRLTLVHYHLRAVVGDVRDPESIAEAMAEQDAVVSMLAQPAASTVTIFSEGTQALADAAEAAGVKRFVTVSAMPAGVDPERLPLAVRMALLLPHLSGVYQDMERMEADLTSREGLEWTIVRPAALSDGPGGNFRIEVGDLVPGGVTTSRIDLALLLLQIVETDAFLNERVAIAD
jgi:putative NADH-flavin reductase